MADLLTTCPTCYPQQVAACTHSIVIDAGLPADTDLKARFDLPTGVVDELPLTTDGTRKATIDLSQLPEGYLNTYTGASIQLSFYDNPAGGYSGAFCGGLTLTINTTVYPCIQLSPVVCRTIVNVQNVPC